MRPRIAIRGSVGPSVRIAFFFIAKMKVFRQERYVLAKKVLGIDGSFSVSDPGTSREPQP